MLALAFKNKAQLVSYSAWSHTPSSILSCLYKSNSICAMLCAWQAFVELIFTCCNLIAAFCLCAVLVRFACAQWRCSALSAWWHCAITFCGWRLCLCTVFVRHDRASSCSLWACSLWDKIKSQQYVRISVYAHHFSCCLPTTHPPAADCLCDTLSTMNH